MDDFVKNAFDKAQEDIKLAKGDASAIRATFDEHFDRLMDMWRDEMGERIANNFAKCIVTFKQEKSLESLLMAFFSSGWVFGQHNLPDATDEEEKAAEKRLNDTAERLAIAVSATEGVGHDKMHPLLAFVNSNPRMAETFAEFTLRVAMVGFHIGWEERGKRR